jgi:hypothetical protein
LTNNPELLSLHAKQQNPTAKGENAVHVSGWMKALVCALTERLGGKSDTLFKKTQSTSGDTLRLLQLEINLTSFQNF